MTREKHTIPPARTAEDAEPRPPLSRRTYDNIYPLFAHDPACRCCHPNDRPYCPCPCHDAPSRGILRQQLTGLRREEIPNEPSVRTQDRPRADPRVTRLPGRVAG
jgi:hypothetical protein